MQMSQLKPAYACAQQFGVKAVIYGGPGSGKTPMISTAPRPVLMATEPGLLSMRTSDVPTWEAYTPAAIDEFFTWVMGSSEARNFDTVAIDSGSQMAETLLARGLAKHKHGMQAYGEMARDCMRYLGDVDPQTLQATGLYFLREKHVVIVCKQMLKDEGNGITKKRPYFPGNELNVKVPHLYDEILHAGIFRIPGVQGEQRALRTTESIDAAARDRSGRLAEYEPCDLTALFNKCMS